MLKRLISIAGWALAIGLLAPGPSFAASFGAAGSLATARDNHTATLLANGKVLVAGGQNAGGALNSVEIYDPANNSWSAAAPMSATRYGHTATLLTTGKVLVAGGRGNDFLNTAEIYDPATNVWTTAANLNISRQNHTATLLANGKVLVTGGTQFGGPAPASAEVYDPAANTWTATGALAFGRENHTATLLPNGKVLAAGGDDGISTSLNSTELYDPGTNMWTLTARLSTFRSYHTATLLPNGTVLVAAGYDGNTVLGSAEVYDPTGNAWSATGALATARFAHTGTLLTNGTVLVTGGYLNTSGYLNSAEVYDPVGKTWSAAPSLATGRAIQTATLLASGKVLIAGGYGGAAGYLSSAEAYDPGNGTWSGANGLNIARYQHTATTLPNGNVLVAGGNGPSTLKTGELYNVSNNSWTTSTFTNARYAHTATLLPSGNVIIAGGYGSGFLTSVETYTPGSNSWGTAGNLVAARGNHSATLLPNGKVLIAGGSNGSIYLNSTELYNPGSSSSSTIANLTFARELHSATLLANGKVLVAGGNDSTFIGSAEIYDPVNNTWTTTNSLTTARYAFTATLLPSGKVLVAGGVGSAGSVQTAELYDPGTGNWSPGGTLNMAHTYPTATLLPGGKVLLAGGQNSLNVAVTSTEVYDPTTNTWSTAGDLGTARVDHTATQLPNGYVLVAGGLNSETPMTSAEVYDPGLGFSSAWQPTLSTATSPLTLGTALTLSGGQFRGFQNESAGGGGTLDSASNIPVMQLQSLVNEQQLNLLCDAANPWSATAYTSRGFYNFPPGYASVRVFVNGIPSAALNILVNGTAPAITSANAASFTYGVAGTFTVTTTGGPLPVIATVSTLPSGVTLTDNHDGTATIASTATALPGGVSIALTANNTINPSAAQTFTLTINKGVLMVTANAAMKSYGAANPAFTGTLTGVAPGDGITATYASTATTSTVPGTYDSSKAEAITPTLSDPNGKLGNYTVTSTKGTLTVTPAALSVAANAASKTYGDANPAFSGTLMGVVNNDGITASYTSSATATTAAGMYTSSAAEAITPNLADPNGKLGNYAVTATNATLTIMPAALSATANPGMKEYGAFNPAFTGTLTGVLNSDGITATYSSSATPSTNAGVYDPGAQEAITPLLADPNAKLGNYTLTATTATLTITTAPLSAAADAGTKVYGTANPVFTGTLTGVLNNDGITAAYVSAAAAGTNAGTYDASSANAITPNLADPNSRLGNYALTSTNAALTITPAPVTVTLNDLLQAYDGTPKTAAAATVPAGVALAITYNGSATAPANAGNYAVVATVIDPNYAGSASGTLIIDQTTIVSTATAVPNPAVVLQAVSFAVSAVNSNQDALTYTWDFGDGAQGSGATVMHAYALPGNYHAVVSADNGLAAVGSSVDVTVSAEAAEVVVGLDSDGDGFSDAFETAVGTNPNNAASTPTGQPITAATLQALTISKASIKLELRQNRKRLDLVLGNAERAGRLHPERREGLFRRQWRGASVDAQRQRQRNKQQRCGEDFDQSEEGRRGSANLEIQRCVQEWNIRGHTGRRRANQRQRERFAGAGDLYVHLQQHRLSKNADDELHG